MKTINQNSKVQQIQELPLWTAGISFVFGTILFLLYLIERNDEIIICGFLYVVAAVVINLAILLAMVALSFIHREHQRSILLHTLVLLLNIPVAVVYLFILFNSNNVF